MTRPKHGFKSFRATNANWQVLGVATKQAGRTGRSNTQRGRQTSTQTSRRRQRQRQGQMQTDADRCRQMQTDTQTYRHTYRHTDRLLSAPFSRAVSETPQDRSCHRHALLSTHGCKDGQEGCNHMPLNVVASFLDREPARGGHYGGPSDGGGGGAVLP